ncbi:MAG: response regulator [Chitinophagales bacterium]
MAPIKVIVFDDRIELRETMELVLTGAQGIEFLGAWENCSEAEHIAEVYKPDVILMDIDMPVVNGIEGTRVLTKRYPHIKIIMLTVFEDDENIFEALCSGAVGYLLKKSSPEKIVSALHEVMEGGAPMTANIALKVLRFFPKNYTTDTPVDYKLTVREKEILQALVKGLSYKLVAEELRISIDTVRTHIRKIYDKLHVNSATEAVSFALKNKIFK